VAEDERPPQGQPVSEPKQQTLDQLWTCDVCQGTGYETDRETAILMRCRTCGGSGLLDYQPSTTENPFDGIETQ
jgi:DnaJ-class molecular chaperone